MKTKLNLSLNFFFFLFAVHFLLADNVCGWFVDIHPDTHTHTRALASRPSAAGVKESFSFQRSCRWSQQLRHGRRSSSCHSRLCDLLLKDSTVMLMKSDPPEGEEVGGGAERKKGKHVTRPCRVVFLFLSSFISSLSGKCRLSQCSRL